LHLIYFIDSRVGSFEKQLKLFESLSFVMANPEESTFRDNDDTYLRLTDGSNNSFDSEREKIVTYLIKSKFDIHGKPFAWQGTFPILERRLYECQQSIFKLHPS
jgi:hypothetical protein